jgi:hypothetical protein
MSQTTEEWCAKCGGSRHRKNSKGLYEPCSCLKRIKRFRALKDAGIPKYMWDVRWEKWLSQNPQAAEVGNGLREWLAGVLSGKMKRAACVAGKSGVGKLTLAYLVIRECVFKGMSARILTLSDLIKDRFEEDVLIDIALNADALCVRLGAAEEEHKWRAPTLERIHFGRIIEERPTFYTTRLKGRNFENAYGAPLHDVFWIKGKDVLVWDMDLGKASVK